MHRAKRAFLILAAGITLFGSTSVLWAGTVRPLASDTDWRYFRGTSEPTNTWNSRDFDDSAWSVGSMPFWYGDGASGTQLPDMTNGYTTLYLRYNFTNWNAVSMTSIVISADYDDAFILWINGKEAWRTAGAPASPAHTSVSSVSHESSAGSGGPWETNIVLNISNFLEWGGRETIAVQAFNIALGNSDFHINVRAVANNSFSSNAIKVACVGDSITQGHQNNVNTFFNSYPAFLQGLMGNNYEVRNYGRGGTCAMRHPASDPYADNPTNTPQWYDSRDWRPDIVVVMLGANDCSTNRNWPARKVNLSNEFDYLIAPYTNHPAPATKVYVCAQTWVATNENPGTHPWAWDWSINGSNLNDEAVPMTRDYAIRRGYGLIEAYNLTYGHYPSWYNNNQDSVRLSSLGYSNVAVLVAQRITPPLAAWTSYNDCAWVQSTEMTGNFTTNAPSGVAGEVRTFSLLNYAGGTLPVQAAYSNAAYPNPYNIPVPPTNSDAYRLFEGRLSYLTNYTQLNTNTIALRFTGLGASNRYSFAMYSSRGTNAVNYSNRWTDAWISGAESFANNSTPGSGCTKFTTSTNNDSTRMESSNLDGKLFRYDGIAPGVDGEVTFWFKGNGTLGQTNGYINAFMLQQFPSAEEMDADQDGLPDEWETLHFGSITNASGSALSDQDGDGFNDWSEYRAGTDPTSASSRLQIEAAATATAFGFVVQWQSVTGRLYTVQTSSNLLAGWTTETNGISGTPPVNAYTDVVIHPSDGFYRVKVE